jgi:hypothetical protein
VHEKHKLCFDFQVKQLDKYTSIMDVPNEDTFFKKNIFTQHTCMNLINVSWCVNVVHQTLFPYLYVSIHILHL